MEFCLNLNFEHYSTFFYLKYYKKIEKLLKKLNLLAILEILQVNLKFCELGKNFAIFEKKNVET